MKIKSFEELDLLLVKLDHHLFSLLDKLQSVEAVDALFHGDLKSLVNTSFFGMIIYPGSLIVAKMAKNPRFEVIAEMAGKSTRGWPPSERADLAAVHPKLIAYLNSEL